MKTIILPGGEHAVLALHGLLGNPLEMQYIGKRLQRAGYTVVIPLIPGYGYATGAGQSYRTTDYQAWYAEVLRHFDQLRATHKTVSVAGLCIGAVLALRLAMDRGDQIAALSLLSTTLAYDGWSLPWYRFLLPLAYYTPARYLYAYQERHPYGLKNENLQRWIAREMKHSGSSAAGASRLSAEGIFQAHRLIKEVRRGLPKVRTPALIVHAQEDDVASTHSADFVEQNIGSDYVRKLILHDCYHIITLDNEKETVADETIAFLGKHAASYGIKLKIA
ncbi:alpha/beta fold hydrolase [Duganella sp. FT80W]|uniref:Alpha/beta fold hydrolase n=1 Tax=Duganella guangzhouensis TaxID=2666084 RepID=A0A6I2L9X4_9BURK|nr:alpha/beta fold hydrolase [Duganella guangzhouensis]MRW93614.1 alpha/beta fold hydrolase [Duganella guangzhouensis]